MVHIPESENEADPKKHRMHILYARRTKEKQVFMKELHTHRKLQTKRLLKQLITSIGPRWYQTLSVLQMKALDSIESCIYQDLLSGRPVQTMRIIKSLGIYPLPSVNDLRLSIYEGRFDPKQMFAQLYVLMNGFQIDGQRMVYSHNDKLLLSAILNLGLNDLIERLERIFRAETEVKPRVVKHKRIPEPPLASPYLKRLIVPLYYPEMGKRPPPAPLPDLSALNDPVEEEPPIRKPPPPPPKPVPKKRIPVSYCSKMAGYSVLEPHKSISEVLEKPKAVIHKKSRMPFPGDLTKKKYGLGLGKPKKKTCIKMIEAPSTGIWNSQYVISGVSIVKGKSVFSLASVSILAPKGHLNHGGHARFDNSFINIHLGYRGIPEEKAHVPCDCEESWYESIMKYVNNTKCNCGHLYDFKNEGEYESDLPFFEKPKKNAPYKFNYDTIYNLDKKNVAVEREFKKVWDNDSMLCDEETRSNKRKMIPKPKIDCLGPTPKEQDYLKCALALMRRNNIAAKLPEIYKVPELVEWMRNRIHGPLTHDQRNKLRLRSSIYWQLLLTMSMHGYGQVHPKKEPRFMGHSNWARKQRLNEMFQIFTSDYKLQIFKSQAKLTNMLWPTMFQAQMPDKKFREIFFSYLYSRMQDLHLVHPYTTIEVAERKAVLMNKRYSCPPKGCEDLAAA